MLINPSHTLRFGKVPASLEKLHNDSHFAPKTVGYTETESKAIQAIVGFIHELERTAKDLAEPAQQKYDANAIDDLRDFINGVAKDIIAGTLSMYSTLNRLGPIETLYQVLKAQPNYAIEEGDPIYKVLAQVFSQFGSQQAK